jgi:DNA-binding CsgD family transcriptional regulator
MCIGHCDLRFHLRNLLGFISLSAKSESDDRGARRPQHANPPAKRLFVNNTAVVESGGCLYCRRPRDDNTLLVALRQLLPADNSCSRQQQSDKVFMRAKASAVDQNLGIYLYALRPQATLHAFGERPLAMALFHEAGTRVALDPFVVAATFDLTPGEARVAVAMASGAAPEDIAKRHAVPINTVRTQLASIFGKTGVTRQAELVSLLASLPMAARGLGDP